MESCLSSVKKVKLDIFPRLSPRFLNSTQASRNKNQRRNQNPTDFQQSPLFIIFIKENTLKIKLKMFKKKVKCLCGKKIDNKYEFCPHCGTSVDESKNYRIRRKKDEEVFDNEIDKITKAFSQEFGMPALASFPVKMLVKKLSKDIEKQFREADQEMTRQKFQDSMFNMNNPNIPKGAKKNSQPIIKDGRKIGNMDEFRFPGGQGFSIQINMNNSQPVLSDESSEENEIQNQKKLPSSRISEADAEKLSKLPRKEPETSVRRLTDKIVYEISLPGVKNEKEITINKLQNSIEIKAFSKDKAYFKLIPVSFPIKNWKLSKEKLILELKA
jgi:hypothetical protein